MGRTVVAFAISTIAHIAIFVLVRDHVLEKDDVSTIPLYEVAQIPRGRPGARGEGGGKGKLSMKDLLLPYEEGRRFGAAPFPSTKGYGEGEGEGIPGGHATRLLKCVGFFSEIYRRIEEELVYPIELAEKGIEGSVQVLFRFAEDGSLLSEGFNASGGSRILQVHAMRSIRRALPDPEPLAKKCARKGILAVFQFLNERYLDVNKEYRPPEKTLYAISDGRMAFLRKHNLWSVLPIHVRIGPQDPNNPAPQGVSFDFLPLIEKGIESLYRRISGKPAPDVLQPYRDDPLWKKTR